MAPVSAVGARPSATRRPEELIPGPPHDRGPPAPNGCTRWLYGGRHPWHSISVRWPPRPSALASSANLKRSLAEISIRGDSTVAEEPTGVFRGGRTGPTTVPADLRLAPPRWLGRARRRLPRAVVTDIQNRRALMARSIPDPFRGAGMLHSVMIKPRPRTTVAVILFATLGTCGAQAYDVVKPGKWAFSAVVSEPRAPLGA